VAGRRNSESRKELEEKELEEKRARGGKELEETKKKIDGHHTSHSQVSNDAHGTRRRWDIYIHVSLVNIY
jgi:hypothetical protein